MMVAIVHGDVNCVVNYKLCQLGGLFERVSAVSTQNRLLSYSYLVTQNASDLQVLPELKEASNQKHANTGKDT